MSLALLWFLFLLCTLAILYAGAKLSRYGDMISEKTGLGGVWIGVILLAFVTSLPELVTGVSSIVMYDLPNIATGQIFGSCVFNMLILALLDAFHKDPISSRVHHRHILSAGFAILLLSIVAVNLFISISYPDLNMSILWIGVYTPLILIIYVLSMRLIFFQEKRIMAAFVKEKVEELKYKKVSTRSVYINFTGNAFVVVIAAIFLPDLGKSIAEMTGLGQTFVGNVLIAFSTSLPEIVVSVAALKIGAADMAIGNLFGSNIFNIGILAIEDILYTKGPLLSYIDASHMFSILSSIIMITIAVIGLTYRARKKTLLLSWDSIAIVSIYILNLFALYAAR